MTFTLAIKTCALFPVVENCKKYDLKTDLNDSSFSCLECNEQFYIINGFPSICKKRVNFPIFNCLSYSIDSDLCQSCMKNFFLSNNKLTCLKNPDGIQKCRKYKSYDECIECEPHTILKNKICEEIPTKNHVQNCYLYNENLICIKCEKGYELKSSICEKVTL